MTTPALPRPPQVTLAGWMIVVGSLLVVGSVVELISGLRSLETRESVEAFLAEPPGESLGWGVETVLSALRATAMVTAGCATAAAVLGWHVLQRNRGARIGLTVLAVPLFVTGAVTGGFMASLVAAASLMLWLQPARDWFNGKQPPAPAARPGSDPNIPSGTPSPTGWWAGRHDHQGQGQGQQSGEQSGGPAQDAPARPVQGFGDVPGSVDPAGGAAPANPHGQAPADPYGQAIQPGAQAGAQAGAQPVSPYGQPYPGSSTHAPVPPRRPGVLMTAALVTWVFAGFAFLSALASVALAVNAPETLMEEVERQQPELVAEGLTQDMMLSTLLPVGALVLTWSLAAVVAAALVLRRSRVAWIALTVLAGGSAVACFLGALVSVSLALPALASVVVLVLLRRPDVRAWLAPTR